MKFLPWLVQLSTCEY